MVPTSLARVGLPPVFAGANVGDPEVAMSAGTCHGKSPGGVPGKPCGGGNDGAKVGANVGPATLPDVEGVEGAAKPTEAGVRIRPLDPVLGAKPEKCSSEWAATCPWS